jgi:hypothetical protein
MKFRSKVDIWLGTLIIAVAAMIVKAAWLMVKQPYGLIETFMLVSIGAVFPVWILLSTSYEINRENLWVRSGPFTWKIRILSISRIEPSHSWMSSPALSLDRFRIEYGLGKVILVSPKESDRFLRAIRDAIAYGSRD